MRAKSGGVHSDPSLDRTLFGAGRRRHGAVGGRRPQQAEEEALPRQAPEGQAVPRQRASAVRLHVGRQPHGSTPFPFPSICLLAPIFNGFFTDKMAVFSSFIISASRIRSRPSIDRTARRLTSSNDAFPLRD